MSDSVQTVAVDLGPRSYEIRIGGGLLADCGKAVEPLGASLAVVVTDDQVGPLYAKRVSETLQHAGRRVVVLDFPAGEQSKAPEVVTRLQREMIRRGADRKSVVVALGGGVVGDLAGFVAASFARGVPLVQVPTTLLAQVDSSVGGKVGVNLPEAKNIVGAFWQPAAVLIDTDVLATVPDRQFRAGLAEVVKYGVILDAEFFAYLEQHVDELNARDADTLTHVIACCCRLKADVVEVDEREETGERAVLNYGHTFGHALETATAYGQLLHGEGVAVGMMCAARLALRLGRIDNSLLERQRALLALLGLPVATPDLPAETLLANMQHDKKTQHGRLRFILPSRLGRVELVDVDDLSQVEASLWD